MPIGRIVDIDRLTDTIDTTDTTTSTGMVAVGWGTFAATDFFQPLQSYNIDDGQITITNLSLAPVPEPSSLALLGTGILGAAGVIRKRLA